MRVFIKYTSKAKQAGYHVFFLGLDDSNQTAICKDIFRNFFTVPIGDLIFTTNVIQAE